MTAVIAAGGGPVLQLVRARAGAVPQAHSPDRPPAARPAPPPHRVVPPFGAGGPPCDVALIGYEFACWVHGLEAGRIVGVRPPGVEGFLPIAALISLKHWLVSGEFSTIHPAGLVILLLALATGLLAEEGLLLRGCARSGRRARRSRACRTASSAGSSHLPRWLDLPLTLPQVPPARLLPVRGLRADVPDRSSRDFLDSPYNRVADIKMLYFFDASRRSAIAGARGPRPAVARRCPTSGAATCAPTAAARRASRCSRR